MTQTANFTAFGKNDIRGIYGTEVTEELFYYTGKGFVKYIQAKTGLQPKDICLIASKKGCDSISPIVPPISVIITSAFVLSAKQ